MCTSGLFNHSLFHQHLFVTPAVRHLAWLVYSRPLLCLSNGQETVRNWPEDIEAKLLELDAKPETLLAHLQQRSTRRLGLYFEQLYGYALIALLGQRILAQNLPVRVAGRTLGELDFLVHDPVSDQVVHHEIAVKFYMGWTGTQTGGRPPGWYGPDTRDQLSHKLKRLREHQLPMWRSDEGRKCLHREGLPEPQATQLGLYGYLFQRQHAGIPPLPDGIRAPGAGVTWKPHAEFTPEPDYKILQLPVTKPDWLGPVQYPPDFRFNPRLLEEALAVSSRRAIMVASLKRTSQGFWLEAGREFLTPEGWCQESVLPENRAL